MKLIASGVANSAAVVHHHDHASVANLVDRAIDGGKSPGFNGFVGQGSVGHGIWNSATGLEVQVRFTL
jgi:hypothetical protein